MERTLNLPVAETFISIQGEGATMGRPRLFIRLAGCNLMCGGQGTQFDKQLHNGATWRCDTIEVWQKGFMKSFDEIFNESILSRFGRNNNLGIVFTGGEPLMQQDKISTAVDRLSARSLTPFIEVETNGTIEPGEELLRVVDLFNCSPKLSNSGNEKSLRYKPEVIKRLAANNSIFKFVVSDMSDWEEICEDYLHLISPEQIYLMPAAGDRDELLFRNSMVANLAIENQVNFSTRLQLEVWDQVTGV